MANSEFRENTVFISGAARGFGQHIAQRFFDEGANLVLSDYSEELLADALSPFSSDQTRVVGVAGDIGLEKTSRQAMQLAKDKFGGLDIAINNAGIVHELVRLHQLDAQEAEKVIQTDLMGVFFCHETSNWIDVRQRQKFRPTMQYRQCRISCWNYGVPPTLCL